MRCVVPAIGCCLLIVLGCSDGGGRARDAGAPPGADASADASDAPPDTAADAGAAEAGGFPADAGAFPADPPFEPNACLPATAPAARGWFRLEPDGPARLQGGIHAFPRNPSLAFVVAYDEASAQARLWRSTNGGRTFCPLQTPGPVVKLYVAAGTTSVLYARLGGVTSTLHRSDDGGDTWSMRTLLPGTDSDMGVHSHDPDILLANVIGVGGAPHQVFRSGDGARSWQPVGQPLPPGTSMWHFAFDPANARRGYGMASASGTPALYGYDDETRELKQLATFAGRLWRRGELVVVDRASRVYAWMPNADLRGRSGVWGRSDDGGVTFRPIGQPVGGITLVDLQAETQGEGHLFATGVGTAPAPAGIFQSRDGGMTWTRLWEGPTSRDAPLVATGGSGCLRVAGAAPRTIHACVTYGVVRSADDGATFSPTVIDVATAGTVTVAPSNADVLYLSSPGALLRSTDGGRRWTPAPLPVEDAAIVAIEPRDPATVYVGGRLREGLFRSSDGGASWVPIFQAAGAVISDIAAMDGSLQVTAGTFVHVSHDRGHTWHHRTNLGVMTTLGASAKDPRIAYAIDSDSGLLFVTRDEWQTFSTRPSGLPPGLYPANPQVHPQNGDTVVLGGYAIAWRTTDAGVTWTELTKSPLGSEELRSVVLHPAPPHRLHLVIWGVRSRLPLQTSDDGLTWRTAHTGLPADAYIASLGVSAASAGTMYALSGGVLWKTTNAGE